MRALKIIIRRQIFLSCFQNNINIHVYGNNVEEIQMLSLKFQFL